MYTCPSLPPTATFSLPISHTVVTVLGPPVCPPPRGPSRMVPKVPRRPSRHGLPPTAVSSCQNFMWATPKLMNRGLEF